MDAPRLCREYAEKHITSRDVERVVDIPRRSPGRLACSALVRAEAVAYAAHGFVASVNCRLVLLRSWLGEQATTLLLLLLDVAINEVNSLCKHYD